MHDQNYEGLPTWDQIKTFAQWSPLISYGQKVLAEADPYKKAILIADALEWVCSQTQTKFDDELVQTLTAVLVSPQGEALVRWIVGRVEGKK